MNSVLLQEALKEHNIPFPDNKMRSGGFIRWGRNSRFWTCPVEDGFFFGDFVSGLSTGVFPNGKIKNGKAIEEYMEKALIERELFYSAAKERAQKIWDEAPFLTFSHKYLERKRALNLGLKVSGCGAKTSMGKFNPCNSSILWAEIAARHIGMIFEFFDFARFFVFFFVLICQRFPK